MRWESALLSCADRRGTAGSRWSSLQRTCLRSVRCLTQSGRPRIDLTQASVVIHYDRWWNAAREKSSDRPRHRFGQSRGVQVFKLVTKNSFEERIDQIIERKKFLLEEAVGADEEDVIKTFTREEIFDLLKMHY